MAIEKYDPSDPENIYKRIFELVQKANMLCQQKGVENLTEENGIEFNSGVQGYGKFLVPLQIEVDGQKLDFVVMALHYGYADSAEFYIHKGKAATPKTLIGGISCYQSGDSYSASNPLSELETQNFIITPLNEISTFLDRQRVYAQISALFKKGEAICNEKYTIQTETGDEIKIGGKTLTQDRKQFTFFCNYIWSRF